MKNHPRTDIEGVDVKAARPLHNHGTRKGDNRKVHEKVNVFSIPASEKKIRDMFDDAFILEDRKKIVGGGPINLEVRPLQAGVAGRHRDNNIDLGRNHRGVSNTVLVHECVHHLRAVDRDRKSPLTKAFKPWDIGEKVTHDSVRNASSVEESCTVAEQMARQTGNDVTGYYYMCQVMDSKTRRWRRPTEEEAERMAREDRKLFTNGRNRRLTGDAAIRSVENNWAKSNIARLKLGRRMAINVVADAKPELGIESLRKSPAKKKHEPAPGSSGAKMGASASRTQHKSRRSGRKA